MAGNGYFMGLLSESQGNNGTDLDGFSSPPVEQKEAAMGTTPTTKGNKKRSKYFSEEEDLLLVRAWLNIGTDPIQGTSQKHFSYSTRVYDLFHAENKIALGRSQNSLMHWWSSIQECVNKFCGCLSRIKDRNQSGKTFENKSEDKDNKSFQCMHCWNILRHEPKWHDEMNQLASQKSGTKKHKASADSFLDLTGNLIDDSLNVDNNENASPEGDAPKRPMGRKKAKQVMRGGGGDACKTLISL